MRTYMDIVESGNLKAQLKELGTLVDAILKAGGTWQQMTDYLRDEKGIPLKLASPEQIEQARAQAEVTNEGHFGSMIGGIFMFGGVLCQILVTGGLLIGAAYGIALSWILSPVMIVGVILGLRELLMFINGDPNAVGHMMGAAIDGEL